MLVASFFNRHCRNRNNDNNGGDDDLPENPRPPPIVRQPGRAAAASAPTDEQGVNLKKKSKIISYFKDQNQKEHVQIQ